MLAVLVVSAWLTPAPAGIGTHEQLWPRSGAVYKGCPWLGITGRPCLTCGMTTAFAHAADGEFVAAVKAQPMGAALAFAASAGFWIALHSAVFGSNAAAAALSLLGRKTLWGTLALLTVSWVYKIAVFKGL